MCQQNAGGDWMNMTHYMELLAVNQPWNLILFMAIPVALAETIAITELAILFTRRFDGMMRKVNKICSIIVGVYFLVIFIYLFVNAVIPFTLNGEWRGWIDIIAVGFYLMGALPLLGLSLIDLGIIGRRWSEEQKLKYHSTFVGIFLVVAHIAMIFGMLDPSIGGHSHHMHM
jgi:hypothetical protein